MDSDFTVTFSCVCRVTQYGEKVAVVGNSKALGKWNATFSSAPVFCTTPESFPVWNSKAIRVASGDEFKFVILGPDGKCRRWETVDNRKIPSIIVKHRCVELQCEWDKPGVDSGPHVQQAPAPTLPATAPSDNFREAWKGRQIQFVRSRSALQRLETEQKHAASVKHSLPSVAALSIENPSCPSFLDKLQLAAKAVEAAAAQVDVHRGEEAPLAALQTLAGAAVYLHWVRTGVLRCSEQGAHFRPCHHAECGLRIFKTLLTLPQANLVGEECSNALRVISRRIMPLLPSFSEKFTCSVPLTRIRDIAHRNDIPQELKAELKHTLQNKLHRSAAPEDLVAAEIMWEEKLKNGPYSADFKHEFTLFLSELREFFNATSLCDKLGQLRGGTLPENLVDNFVRCKNRADSQSASLVELVAAIKAAAELRTHLASPPRTTPLPILQVLCQADTALETATFPLLSRVASTCAHWNSLEGPSEDPRWDSCWHAAELAVQHMQLSNFSPEECRIIMDQMQLLRECWGKQTPHVFSEEPDGLHLYAKAVLERAVVLVESFVNLALRIYLPVAEALGNATRVPQHVITVDAESEVRASTAFQLSRLVSGLLGSITAELGESGVEVIVEPPRGVRLVGRVTHVKDLWQLPVNQGEDPVVLVLKSATGDEEVAGLRENHGVVCLVLEHSIPHLCHLAIRLRQERLPCLTIIHPQAELRESLAIFDGKHVELLFDVGAGPEIKEVTGGEEEIALRAAVSRCLCEVPELTPPSPATDATEASYSERTDGYPALLRDCSDRLKVGAKAAACAELKSIAKQNGQRIFSAPNCWVLPFGFMEATLQTHGRFDEYSRLLSDISVLETDNLPEAMETLDSLLAQLHGLIASVTPPPAIFASLWDDLKDLARELDLEEVNDVDLIARSSANFEDLEGMSAAGLYESIGGVNPLRDFDQFARSLVAVWQSLHSRRAVLSRQLAQIQHHQARMAVLVQDMCRPYVAFVLHTRCPLQISDAVLRRSGVGTADPYEWIYCEAALGLGEVLASGSERGSPFRMLIHKETGKYCMLAFSSLTVKFGTQQKVQQTGKRKASVSGSMLMIGQHHQALPRATEFIHADKTNFAKDVFTLSTKLRRVVAQKLAICAGALEAHFAGPQDVEGSVLLPKAFYDDGGGVQQEVQEDSVKLVVVQTRPQPL